MSLGAAGMDTEDAKRPDLLQSADGGSMEARFYFLCKSDLGLDERTMEEAVELFGESKQILSGIMSSVGSGSPEMVERCWSAFLLYCVTRLCAGKEKPANEDSRVKLSHILEVVKLNVVEFFKEVSHFALKADNILSTQYGPDWEKKLGLKELQANIEQLCCLSRDTTAQEPVVLAQPKFLEVDGIMANEFISCLDAENRYLIHWNNQPPPPEDTWLSQEDLKQLAPNFLSKYIMLDSLEKISSST